MEAGVGPEGLLGSIQHRENLFDAPLPVNDGSWTAATTPKVFAVFRSGMASGAPLPVNIIPIVACKIFYSSLMLDFDNDTNG